MSLRSSIAYFQKLMLLIALFSAHESQAQMEDIPLGKGVTVDRLYVGLLAHTGLYEFSDAPGHLTTAQFGARVRIAVIPETFHVRSFSAFKITEGQAERVFRNYEAILKPNRRTSIHFGVMATPTTEIRPNPTTSQSQIETNAEKTIIGGRQGLKLNYELSENLRLSYGLHNHDGNARHHLKIEYERLLFASFIEQGDMFIVAKWKFKEGNVLATRGKHKTTLSTLFPFGTEYKFYADLEYRDDVQELTYVEFGLRRYFPEDGLLKGFLSLSYHHQSETIHGGLFIHI